MAQRKGAGPYTNYSKNYRPAKKSTGAADARFLKAMAGSGRLSEGGASGLVGAAARAITRAAARSAAKSSAKSATKATAKASAKTGAKETVKVNKPTAAYSKGGINAKYTRTPSGSMAPKSKRGIDMMTPAQGTPAQKGQATKMMKAWRAENAGKPAAKPSAASSTVKTKTNWSAMKPGKGTVAKASAAAGGVTAAGALAAQSRKSKAAANRADLQARLEAKKSKKK